MRQQNKQTEREGGGGNGGPLPARGFPPRLREPARRTAALASAPRRRRDTTAVMTDASGKGWCERDDATVIMKPELNGIRV